MFTSIVKWLKSLRKSKVAEQETQDYIARLERAVDELTIELDYREYLAKQEAERAEAEREDHERDVENLKYELGRKQDVIEDYARDEQERRAREEEDEQQHYRSHCPHCGSQRRFGRCPACDEAFGRN